MSDMNSTVDLSVIEKVLDTFGTYFTFSQHFCLEFYANIHINVDYCGAARANIYRV